VRGKTIQELTSPVAGTVAEILVQPGENVTRGQVLAKLDARDAETQLRIAEARVEEAEADLKVRETALAGAARRFDRLRSLTESGSAPITETDTAETELATAEAMLQKARASRQVAVAQLDQQEIVLDRHQMRAPQDGTVVSIPTFLGQHLRPDMTAFLFAPGGGETPPTPAQETPPTGTLRGR
jgi:multidrug efflux pump subunit AcrA (membrane-fusion protein)